MLRFFNMFFFKNFVQIYKRLEILERNEMGDKKLFKENFQDENLHNKNLQVQEED